MTTDRPTAPYVQGGVLRCTCRRPLVRLARDGRAVWEPTAGQSAEAWEAGRRFGPDATTAAEPFRARIAEDADELPVRLACHPRRCGLVWEAPAVELWQLAWAAAEGKSLVPTALVEVKGEGPALTG